MIAAGHLADECFARGEERRVRTAVAQRHAESLRVAVDDVGAHFAGRRQQGQAEQIRSDGDQAPAMRFASMKARRSCTAPDSSGVCTSAPKKVPYRTALRQSPTTNSMPRGSARVRRTSMVCGKHESATKNFVAFEFDAMQHGHRLGGRRRFIEQRRVGDFHAGQIADHGLEIEQAFESPLRQFGLIRRVGRVPAGIFEHVAQDDAGRDAIGIAEARDTI